MDYSDIELEGNYPTNHAYLESNSEGNGNDANISTMLRSSSSSICLENKNDYDRPTSYGETSIFDRYCKRR